PSPGGSASAVGPRPGRMCSNKQWLGPPQFRPAFLGLDHRSTVAWLCEFCVTILVSSPGPSRGPAVAPTAPYPTSRGSTGSPARPWALLTAVGGWLNTRSLIRYQTVAAPGVCRTAHLLLVRGPAFPCCCAGFRSNGSGQLQVTESMEMVVLVLT